MTAGLTATFFGLGVGAWVYSKIARHTGNNYKVDYTVAIVIGLMATFFFYVILKQVVHF